MSEKDRMALFDFNYIVQLPSIRVEADNLDEAVKIASEVFDDIGLKERYVFLDSQRDTLVENIPGEQRFVEQIFLGEKKNGSKDYK